jgi:hypothetical protein
MELPNVTRPRHNLMSCDDAPCPFCRAINLKFAGAVIHSRVRSIYTWRCETCNNYAVIINNSSLQGVQHKLVNSLFD